MKSKLTLRLDENLIHQAKNMAAQQGKSVSKMVEDFFALLAKDSTSQTKLVTTQNVLSLKGILKGKNVEVSEYHTYLENKYL